MRAQNSAFPALQTLEAYQVRRIRGQNCSREKTGDKANGSRKQEQADKEQQIDRADEGNMACLSA